MSASTKPGTPGDRIPADLASPGETFEIPVLIVGGGINGLGLYRELALQGIEVLLVDKGDFMAGASAASSHMIHGGLRYLQNNELRLVWESLGERNRLLRNAPHFVHPLPTTIPIFSWMAGLWSSLRGVLRLGDPTPERGAGLVGIGLSLYDLLCRLPMGERSPMPRHRFHSKQHALAERPGLDPAVVCTATYYDAWIREPERLGLELLLDAERANPRCRAINHLGLDRLDRLEGGAVVLVDGIDGREVRVRPRVLVNATGAWVDLTQRALDRPTRWMGGTKGSHLVLDHPELHRTLAGESLYFENDDHRICILLPFHDKVLAGTTDLPVDDPDQARCDEAEVDYILGSIRGVFPGLAVGREQIVFRYCGVRPLPASNASTPGKISRDHRCEMLPASEDRPFPILALIGGKWTTFRALAETAADRVLEGLGAPRRQSSHHLAIGGGVGFPTDATEKRRWQGALTEESGVELHWIERWLPRYGTRTRELALFVGHRDDRSLDHHPAYSRGEIEWLVANERVVRLEDLMLRRTSLAMRGELGAPLAAELSHRLASHLGWDETRRRDELDHLAQRLRQHHGITLAADVG